MRYWLAAKIHRFVTWLEGRVDEDPLAWEVSLVKVAVAAESREDAVKAVHAVALKLDEWTIYKILVLLAVDVAWSDGLGADDLVAWVERRKFGLILEGFDDSAA